MSKHKSKRNPKSKSYKRPPDSEEATKGSTTLSSIIKSERFRFIVFFTLSCIGLYAFIQLLPPSFIRPINEHVAATMGMVLNVFGIAVATTNDVVSDGFLAFRIIPECTPLFTIGLFSCFVLIYPATLHQKAAGLAMGIPVLYLGNLARLAATFIVSRYDRRFFEVVHVYLGQVFTISLVILSCFLWLKWLDEAGSKRALPMRAIGFLTRFVLISGCLFLVWIKAQFWYVWFLDRFMILGFLLFDYHINLAHDTVVYYETFSIITLISMALANLTVSWSVKIKGLVLGLSMLFLIHLFHRIDNALIAYFHFTAALTVDLTLLLIGQYLLPLLFLVFLSYYPRKKVPVSLRN